jgi:hypothetical protein
MKPVVLAVLLLLAVASIGSGGSPVASIVSGDRPVASVVSGDKTESGKSRYGDEKCLSEMQLKHQADYSNIRRKSAGSVVCVVSRLPDGSRPNRDSIATMIKEDEKCLMK